MPPLREGHLIHFPCMLSYHPKVNGDFSRGKGIGDKESHYAMVVYIYTGFYSGASI